MAQVPVVMFHRVGDQQYMHHRGLRLSGEHCPLKMFIRTMEYIRGNGLNVISLYELVTKLCCQQLLPPNSVVLTFDDGTRDHLKIVLPILEQCGFPATFFVMSGPPVFGKIPPTFQLQLITGDVHWVKEHGLSSLLGALEEQNDQEFTDWCASGAGVPEERYIGEASETIRRIKYLINYLLPAELKQVIVDAMFKARFPDMDMEDVCKLMFLSKEEIHELAAHNLIDIGFHTRNHFNLATIEDPSVARTEIVGACSDLGLVGDLAPKLFAYPSGGKLGYNLHHVGMARAAYQGAVVTWDQKTLCSDTSNEFEIPRVHEKFFPTS